MLIIICIFGFYLYALMGHGSYMGFRYADLGMLYKREVKWIDAILNFSLPKVDNPINKDSHCLLGMALRGLHIAPLFIALAVYYQNRFIICLSWGMMLQGVIYYVFNSLLLPVCVKHNIDCNACAEYATGGLIGLLIVIMKGML